MVKISWQPDKASCVFIANNCVGLPALNLDAAIVPTTTRPATSDGPDGQTGTRKSGKGKKATTKKTRASRFFANTERNR